MDGYLVGAWAHPAAWPSTPIRPHPPPTILIPAVSNSFTFQNDPELAAQLQAGMRASAGGASADSDASSITFKTAAAAMACCTEA